MKKISFGHSNEENPKGSYQGIGINPGLSLTEADYYDTLKYENNSYIIAKVTEDKFGHYPNLVGNFIVRPAIADLYHDGSGVIFLDQEETIVSQAIETYLNNPNIKDKIKDYKDILTKGHGRLPADSSFEFLTMDNFFPATSIKHEIFEKRNELLKSCRGSFSELQEQLLNRKNNHRK